VDVAFLVMVVIVPTLILQFKLEH